MLAYLTRQGVVPPEWSGVEPDFAEPEDQEEPDDPAEEIVREIVGALNTNPPSGDYRIPTAGPRPANIEAPAPYVPPTPFVLLPLMKCNSLFPPRRMLALPARSARPAPAAGRAAAGRLGIQRMSNGTALSESGGRSWSTGWNSRACGLEGIQIRKKHVIWTSRSDPGVDHDIMSVPTDGKPLWIEVKSTMGTDGRFEWPRAEFEKALREGDHYELWRVYGAHTERPTVKAFRDPASLLRTSALRLELSSLRAFVEAKDQGS